MSATPNIKRLSSTDKDWSLRWRMIKDRLVKYGVAVGGVSIIFMILLIFFYLFVVVLPLFSTAEVEPVEDYVVPGSQEPSLLLAMEEQHEVAMRLTQQGKVIFFKTADGRLVSEYQLPLPQPNRITAHSAADPATGVMAVGTEKGEVLVFQHAYTVTYPNNRRLITPKLKWPIGETTIDLYPGQIVGNLTVQKVEDGVVLAAAFQNGEVKLVRFEQETSLLGDEGEITQAVTEIPPPPGKVTALRLDKDAQELYLLTENSSLSFYDISDPDSPELVQHLPIVADGEQVNDIQFLAGGISLLVSDSVGRVSQWFPVRDEEGKISLTKVREFKQGVSKKIVLAPEHSRKGFLAADESGRIALIHTTAERVVLQEKLLYEPIINLAIAPRANAYLLEDASGKLHFGLIDNEHPEVSWSSLWGKVWYESYAEPQYRWQSSSASNDFEPKFSLVPITFGTIKAAFYAMVIAVPLSIMGAIFTAQFMSPRMRKVVKPSVEIMEALPTVILGFLAGLWLAPFVEKYLPGVFTLLIIMPPGVLIAAYLWHRMPESIRYRVPEGWEAALLVPVISFLAWLSIALSPLIENSWFGGDMRVWLAQEMGVDFDQRNSIVVGLAMGFAVIPTIFSIAEDALFAVPKHLVNGSLALGATAWQTMVRVVLLTASPGIFSAVMIGFGRAVGETMIVLMATGNTPVMDMSIFQGMRTLSANIAVEMPESEVDSTHYRILFLAALVLFIFTFLFNTLGEVVRQRLRKKYSSL